MNKLYGEEFPWFHIKKITFFKKGLKAVIEFRSGNSLKVSTPDEEKWDEMIRSATLNLNRDQVFYE